MNQTDIYNMNQKQPKSYPAYVHYTDGTSEMINIDSRSKENFTKSKKDGLLFCISFNGKRIAINYDKILKLEY